jgi:geranylgeranyl pyrophosphate synthase
MILAKAIAGDRMTSDLEDKVKTWSAVIEMIHNSSLLQVIMHK